MLEQPRHIFLSKESRSIQGGTNEHLRVQLDQPDVDVAEAWRECAKVVKEYNSEIVKRWKAEIDTLLVYVRPGLAGPLNGSGNEELIRPHRLASFRQFSPRSTSNHTADFSHRRQTPPTPF